MTPVLKGANLALSFLLELAVLAAVAYRGYTLVHAPPARWTLAVVAVLGWGTVWGLFGAPKATYAAHGAGRVVLEALWFGSAAVALLWAGRRELALVFVAAYVLNTVLRVAWNQV